MFYLREIAGVGDRLYAHWRGRPWSDGAGGDQHVWFGSRSGTSQFQLRIKNGHSYDE